nr:hypothetical protein [Tanacetum cinerariifolium]GFA11823.1 hypothetical protein [Tanacetum cinerariifolium]
MPPVNDGQRRRPPVNGGQRHRSMEADHSGDRRSTVAVNDGRRWRTTVDCRWTTVDLHRTTGQRWLVGRSTSGSRSGLDRVWAGSGSGLDRVRVRSATWHATCQPRVPTWQLTWILSNKRESNPVPLGWNFRQNQENHCASPDTKLVLYPIQDKLTLGDKSLDLSAFKLSRLFFSLLPSRIHSLRTALLNARVFLVDSCWAS